MQLKQVIRSMSVDFVVTERNIINKQDKIAHCRTQKCIKYVGLIKPILVLHVGAGRAEEAWGGTFTPLEGLAIQSAIYVMTTV